MALVDGSLEDRAGVPTGQGGFALVVVLMSLSTVLGLGLLLAVSTMTEQAVAATALEGRQVVALADATAEHVLTDLAVLPSWDDALAGTTVSRFFDGRAGRRVVAGQVVDLEAESARVICGAAPCGLPSAVTATRPWGVNNPLWEIFASGSSEGLLGSRVGLAPGYVVAWVADDPTENDGDPRRDGGPPVAAAGSIVNPGAGVVWVKVVAWGPRGSRCELEVSVERDDPIAQSGLRVRTWRQVRGAWP